MTIKTYVARVKTVKAVRLTAANSIEVAAWCGARVLQPGNRLAHAILELPNGQFAWSGDWIAQRVELPPLTAVFHDQDFEQQYEAA